MKKGFSDEQKVRIVLEYRAHGRAARLCEWVQAQAGTHADGRSRIGGAQTRDTDCYPSSLERPLGAMLSLYLDARYEKVHNVGQVLDCAVLIAVGVDRSGKRQVLGVSVTLSEAGAPAPKLCR